MKIAIKCCDAYRKEKRGWHASSRIRGHWLAEYWDELDDIFYPDYFKQEYHEFFELENQLEKLKDYDVVILHKTYEWELAKALRLRGQKVVIDLSDPDYLIDYSGIHRSALCLLTIFHSDALVVNNEKMIEDLKSYDKPICYIPDRIDPKIIETENTTYLVWFGHSDNAESLTRNLSKLKGHKITAITDKPIEGVEFIKYNPETICNDIKLFDAVFLGDKLSEYKSTNRWQLARALNMPIVTIDDLDMDMKESVKEWENLLTKI